MKDVQSNGFLEILENFEKYFYKRPAMLGTPSQIYGMLFVIDQVQFVLRTESLKDYPRFSFHEFLNRSKWVCQSKNILEFFLVEADIDSAYTELQKLWSEYKQEE